LVNQVRLAAAVADASDVESWSDLASFAAAASGASAAVLLRYHEEQKELELIAGHELDERMWQLFRRLPVDDDTIFGRAVQSLQPVELQGLELRTHEGIAAGVVFPLTVDQRPLGVVGFLLPDGEPPRPARLAKVAAAVRNAFDRLERDRERDRTLRLQRLTAKLAAVQSRSEIAETIVDEAIAATGAQAGSVFVNDERRGQLRLVAYRGYSEQAAAAFDPLPEDLRTPLRDAAEFGKVVVVETADEYEARYPGVRDRAGVRLTPRAAVAVPLAAGGSAFGAVGLAYPPLRIFDHDERAFLLAVARLCAQALDRSDRARLYDRVARLQTVTAELARAVTPADVGRVVIREMAAALGADSGRIALFDEHGELVTLAQTHDFDEVATRLTDAGHLNETPLGVAARLNQEVLVESIGADAAAWEAAAPVYLELGLHAAAAVPLPAAAGPLGAIGFAWRRRRPLLHDFAPFLHATAAVCAQALERTRLFEEAERSRLALHAVLDRLGEAVLVVDRPLTISYANREAHELFGRQRLIGLELPDPWPELRLRSLARAQLEREAEPCSVSATLADARTLDVGAIPDEGRVVLVLRDVTRRERQERLEREFVQNASHELRTPLAAIAAAIDALQVGAKEKASERDYLLSGVEGEVARLSRLVDALLLLARAQGDPGSFACDEVDLEQLLDGIVSRLQPRPGVRVQTACGPCTVHGDRTLLEAAISNLAQNAVRHTEHGTIELACAVDADGGGVTISVSDTGDGMTDEVRSRATERFYRGAVDGNGFGLGLALARQIVDVLGGELAIEPRRPHGTTMSIRLPVRCESAS
jgi:signal transduction histidine kinase